MLWKALIVEIKNSITKSLYHLIRYGGLLIIPLIYGFSYIFAFYDPFVNTKKLDVAVVTEKGDNFSTALGHELEKEQELHVGEMEMVMQMNHIYNDEHDIDEIKKDNYATLVIPKLDQVIVNAVTPLFVAGTTNKALAVMTAINQLTDAMEKNKFNIYTNNKKNYLIAFGVDVGMSMSGSVNVALSTAIKALSDPGFISSTISAIPGYSKDTYDEFVHSFSAFQTLHPIHVESHGFEKPKYGYGLAPFFISVAMWIGGMVMTFAIHRKIYDTKATPTQRYFAKWILINFGVFIQATILMFALYFIGFKDLGNKNFFTMYGFTILTGIIFASIIQAIRFCIHDRNISIFIIILLLVLQMASGGGLFPVETQSGFYQVLNKFIPMGHSVRLFREAAVETNWGNLMKEFGYLSIYLLIIPLGVYINHKRTMRYYKKNNIIMPTTILEKEAKKKLLKDKGGA